MIKLYTLQRIRNIYMYMYSCVCVCVCIILLGVRVLALCIEQGPVGCQLTHLTYMEVNGHTPQYKHKGLPLGQHRSGHVSENTPGLGDAKLELYSKNMKPCSINLSRLDRCTCILEVSSPSRFRPPMTARGCSVAGGAGLLRWSDCHQRR